jgi:hypothetical protein
MFGFRSKSDREYLREVVKIVTRILHKHRCDYSRDDIVGDEKELEVLINTVTNPGVKRDLEIFLWELRCKTYSK